VRHWIGYAASCASRRIWSLLLIIYAAVGNRASAAGYLFWNRMDEHVVVYSTKEAAMDWNRVEGNWKQMKGAVKQQWGKLTDDDLTQINGSQEKLEGIIQERYGIAKDEIRKQLDSWYQNQSWQ
jgi:uncharacterized protein YjbJ (UPF0337 family)